LGVERTSILDGGMSAFSQHATLGIRHHTEGLFLRVELTQSGDKQTSLDTRFCWYYELAV